MSAPPRQTTHPLQPGKARQAPSRAARRSAPPSQATHHPHGEHKIGGGGGETELLLPGWGRMAAAGLRVSLAPSSTPAASLTAPPSLSRLLLLLGPFALPPLFDPAGPGPAAGAPECFSQPQPAPPPQRSGCKRQRERQRGSGRQQPRAGGRAASHTASHRLALAPQGTGAPCRGLELVLGWRAK